MKTLLIRPPYTRLRGTGQIPYFPLGIGYVAAMLEKNGFEVAIYNAENLAHNREVVLRDERDVFNYRSNAQKNYMEAINDDNHYVWREVKETLQSFNPDIIGISLISVEYAAALKISKICKEWKGDIKVIWGGFHPTFMPEGSLKNIEVDVVVAGEGENTAVELYKAFKHNKSLYNIPGLFLRNKNGTVFFTGQRPLISDLDEIPFPARHLRLYPETYNPIVMGSLITSRGCPYRCTFCGCRNLWDKKFRRRSPKNVIKEIVELVEKYDTNHVFFMDDTFGLNKKNGIELCHEIINSKLNIVWTTGTRVDKVDDELILYMKRAGCVYIDLGIETGSERMSKIIKKDITHEAIWNAIKIINRNGIASGAFFMAGFLEETLDDLEDTFKMIKETKTTHIALNVWDPMPGSDLYDQAVEMGVVEKDADWSNFPLWPDRNFAVNIDPESFNDKVNEIAEWVYKYNASFYSYFRKIRPKIASLIRKDPKYLFYRSFKTLGDNLLRKIWSKSLDPDVKKGRV